MGRTFVLTVVRLIESLILVRIDWKKYFIRLLFIVIVIAILAAVPPIIENVIVGSIDLSGIQKSIQQSFRKKTGLQLSISGVRFDLFYGIVFTGVSFQDPAKDVNKDLLGTENLVLKVSYLKILNNEFPVTGIHIHGGELDLTSMEYREWIDLLDRLNQKKPPEVNPGSSHPGATDQSPSTNGGGIVPYPHEFAGLEYSLEDIRLLLPEYLNYGDTKSTIIDRAHLDLHAIPVFSGQYEYTFAISLESKNRKKSRIDGGGLWNNARERRIAFTLDHFPLSVLHLLLRRLDGFPSTMPDTGVVVSGGTLPGKGSISIFDNGLGINVEGTYENLHASLPFDDTNIFELKEKQGAFKYNAGFRYAQKDPVFTRLSVQGKSMELDLRYRNANEFPKGLQQKEQVVPGTTIKARLKFTPGSDGLTSTYLPMDRGEFALELHARRPDRQNQIPLRLRLNGSGLQFLSNSFSAGLFETKGDRKRNKAATEKQTVEAPLELESFHLQVDPDGQAKVISRGHVFRAPLFLEGNGSVLAYSQTQRNGQKDLLVKRQWDTDVQVDSLSYRTIASVIRTLAVSIHSRGTGSGGHVEAMGAVWKNKFIETPFYRKILAPLQLQSRIQLTNLKEASNLPANIDMDFSVNARRITMQIPRTDSIRLDYTGQIDGFLPRHNLRFGLRWDNQPLEFPQLLGLKTGPEKLYLNYTYWGEGFLAGDLLSRSNSYLSADLGKIDLSNSSPGRIAIYSLNLPAEELKANQFSFRRITDGLAIQYERIAFQSDNVSAYGNGQYESVNGGQVRLHYTINQSDSSKVAERGVMTMKLMKDHSWVPDDEDF